MDRVPLTTDKPEAIPVQEESVHLEGLGFMDNIEYHRAADGLDINYEDRNDSKVSEQVDYLMDYAKEITGKEDRLDLLLALKSIQRSLGYTETGKTGLKKLYNWVRLDSQRRRIEKKMEVYA